METKRDWLDYVDIIVKILGGTILVGVLSVLDSTNKLKQQEIDNSLKYGEFTKSLMQDLLTQDSSHLKSDVALITLNRTIGERDPKLIADLGARIIENFLEDKVQSDRSTMRTIVAIVKERDTATYNAVKVLIDDYNSRAAVVTPIKNEMSVKDTQSIVQNITDKSWAKLTLIPAKATVFIQVNNRNDNTLALAGNLQKELNDKGFNAPGIEAITKFPFQNSIRYFYASDENAAKQVQAYVQSILKLNIKIQKVNNYKTRNGLIELWVNLN
ncbi:hypothetical protein [Mucilaginibacter sp. OK283]|jgi:hypothetical protein|uniref:hypothetical protein n=1 Tax=Mucilaginibacter sp. OK283 TaxID=1881049 RepID=UPI0008C68723|nr:hypothetical protein [Mucilaginibacter sp. OK283]SEO16121.1 hypothetical protein SAMN05428947_101529 [Mucilaginibacter sp. OK283]